MSRLQDNIVKIGSIGKNQDGSITRISFSPEYFKALEQTKKIMEDAGLTVTIDRVGNIRGFLKGTDSTKKVIAIGSHMDTVRNGGMLDGLAGVIAGIECIYKLKESNKKTKHTIEIIGFVGEEVNEDTGALFGSSAMMGVNSHIIDGSMTEGLKKNGMTLEDVLSVKVNKNDYQCYLEIHIEQGDRLFQSNNKIGIVKGIVGILRYRIKAYGESNHAGTTTMESRKDALVGMSKLIVEINNRAKRDGSVLVATVGTLEMKPGVINVVPEYVESILELRDMDESRYRKFVEDIEEYSKTIPDARFVFEQFTEKGPVKCNDEIMLDIEEICKEKDISYMKIPSGAGHDAKVMAQHMPIGMIFVPSVGGLSHCGREFTEWADIDLGTEVLYDTLLKLDER